MKLAFAFMLTTLAFQPIAAYAQAVDCDLSCAEEVLSKPNLSTAAVMKSEVLLAQSLTKHCPEMKITQKYAPAYQYFLTHMTPPSGLTLAEMRKSTDETAALLVQRDGCNGVLSELRSKYTVTLLGGA